jgi:hypothetical protein
MPSIYQRFTNPPKFNPALYIIVTPINTDIIEHLDFSGIVPGSVATEYIQRLLCIERENRDADVTP